MKISNQQIENIAHITGCKMVLLKRDNLTLILENALRRAKNTHRRPNANQIKQDLAHILKSNANDFVWINNHKHLYVIPLQNDLTAVQQMTYLLKMIHRQEGIPVSFVCA